MKTIRLIGLGCATMLALATTGCVIHPGHGRRVHVVHSPAPPPRVIHAPPRVVVVHAPPKVVHPPPSAVVVVRPPPAVVHPSPRVIAPAPPRHGHGRRETLVVKTPGKAKKQNSDKEKKKDSDNEKKD